MYNTLHYLSRLKNITETAQCARLCHVIKGLLYRTFSQVKTSFKITSIHSPFIYAHLMHRHGLDNLSTSNVNCQIKYDKVLAPGGHCHWNLRVASWNDLIPLNPSVKPIAQTMRVMLRLIQRVLKYMKSVKQKLTFEQCRKICLQLIFSSQSRIYARWPVL